MSPFPISIGIIEWCWDIFHQNLQLLDPFLHSSSQCKNWYGLLLQIPTPEVLLSLHKSLPKSSYIAMVDTEELEALFHSWWLKSQEVICLQSCWESVSITRLCNWILELWNSAVILECQRWDSHPSHSWCNGTGENGTLRNWGEDLPSITVGGRTACFSRLPS